MMTPERMEAHIFELGVAFHVRVIIKRKAKPDQAGAQKQVGTGRKRIVIPPVTSEESYAVALHEMGHCVAPLGMMWEQKSLMGRALGLMGYNLSDFRIQLEEERAAWKWAEHYALEWTDRMANVRKMTFATYKRMARRVGAI